MSLEMSQAKVIILIYLLVHLAELKFRSNKYNAVLVKCEECRKLFYTIF
jgi:hypothetical protein